MRHLLQLLKLVRFHQLVLGLVTVRGALQLNVFKNVSVHEGSNDCQRTKSSVLGLNSPLLQSLLWRPACYPASEGCSLFASGPDSRSKEVLHKKVKENEERPIRPAETWWEHGHKLEAIRWTYSQEIRFELDGHGQIRQGRFGFSHRQEHRCALVEGEVVLRVSLCEGSSASS